MPIILIMLLISGCNLNNFSITPTWNPTQTVNKPWVTSTPVHLTETSLPTQTVTATATVIPTPVWEYKSGTITCPILLYHRVAEPPSPNSSDARYFMPPEELKWQLQALKDWGYTTIPMSLLVTAIIQGAQLPPRPVVISFDDGYETVFENAYPIMRDFGFSGILYIVGEYIGAKGYMSADQLTQMAANGWEIGSHSMTHPHLPIDHGQINFEAGQSKNRLASELGVNIETFAYPYGEIDGFIVGKVSEYGYLAAVGLGTQYAHNLSTLFYLSRIEVRNGTDLGTFAALLPWSNKP
jgi:peptidoglycan/xylan/chitin deacetylase (PgdA/CDA1 family)